MYELAAAKLSINYESGRMYELEVASTNGAHSFSAITGSKDLQKMITKRNILRAL